MGELSLGWVTDLAIRKLTGATIEYHGDHIVVRSPDNPSFHWGNFVLVTDEASVDDAHKWVSVFSAAFPEATWVAIGLIRTPDEQVGWVAQGVDIVVDHVLCTQALLRLTTLADGYDVRQLDRGDWDLVTAMVLKENGRTGEYERHQHEQFVRARVRSQRHLNETGRAAFFGAFAGDALVAHLGIVRCGSVARYQNVVTDRQHRRVGLASYLLGVAARWAGERGCDQWVILTEATNPAGRVYKSVGFEVTSETTLAYRRPPRG